MFELLRLAKYGDGKYIDIAKGKNKLPTSIKEAIKVIKREGKKR